MPVYNAERFLERSIESLNKQTLKDVELICVNDGSTDNSQEILENLQKQYDFLKVINQENSGSGKARNTGIDNAQGEYLAFLDADDIFVDEDALERMYAVGCQNDANVVGANLIRVNNEGEFEENQNYSLGNYAYFSDESVVESENYGIPWAFYKNIFKTSFINENNIRFPDLLRGQDPVFLAEILTKTENIYSVNCDLYGYYYDAAGKANDKINTTDKKRDYICHYKQTFSVLDQNDFKTISEAYKNTFIKIIQIKEREHDDEFIELIFEVFPNLDKYFDKNSYSYSYLSIIQPSDNSETTVNMNKLLQTKEEFINTTLKNNQFIDLDEIRDYNKKLARVKDDKDFKKQSYKQLYDIHEVEDSNYNTIKAEVDSISDEVEKMKKANNEILSSNAWKYTKFLRDIKHYLK